jgi:hypothetical protein
VYISTECSLSFAQKDLSLSEIFYWPDKHICALHSKIFDKLKWITQLYLIVTLVLTQISQNQITRWKSIFLRTSNFDAQISLTLKKPQINVDQFVIFDLDLTYGHLHNTRQTPLLLAQIW